jgi:hypothetical protein
MSGLLAPLARSPAFSCSTEAALIIVGTMPVSSANRRSGARITAPGAKTRRYEIAPRRVGQTIPLLGFSCFSPLTQRTTQPGAAGSHGFGERTVPRRALCGRVSGSSRRFGAFLNPVKKRQQIGVDSILMCGGESVRRSRIGRPKRRSSAVNRARRLRPGLCPSPCSKSSSRP